MQDRKGIDSRAFSMMVVLCMIWAFQQIAIKAAAVDVAPTLQIAIRSGVAAVLVGLLMAWRREPLALADGSWKPGLVVGALFGIEFVFLGEGLRYTTASHMAVFLYTAPFFAAIGLHWRLPEEKLALAQWLGILVAFIGIVVAFAGRDAGQVVPNASNMLLGDFLGVLAGAAWGATTVVVRCSRLSHTSASKTLLYQLIGGFIVLMVAAMVSGQMGFRPTALAISSVAFQSIIVGFISFLAWFWLLTKYLASRLGVFSFMTPLFGIFFGVWLLDEPLDTSFLIGAVLVATGIVMVSGYTWLKQLVQRYLQRA